MLWISLHDRLPASNCYNMPTDLRGIILRSQIFARPPDLCKNISDSTIQSVDGFQAIMEKTHKGDPSFVVSDVYQDLKSLLANRRGHSELFKNFKSRFEAQVSNSNSTSPYFKLPDAITAFISLSNASVDRIKRISVHAAASQNDTHFSATADFLEAVS